MIYYQDGAGGLDTNNGTSTGTPWQTLSHALASTATGDWIWVRGTGIINSISTGLSTATGGLNLVTVLAGYGTTPGDGGMATIQTTAAITAMTINNENFVLFNMILDGNTHVGSKGVVFGMSTMVAGVVNCLIKGFSGPGFDSSAVNYNCKLIDSEVTDCAGSSGQGAVIAGLDTLVSGCKIHGNTNAGITFSGGNSIRVINNRIYGNTGASSDGILYNGQWPMEAIGNTIHGNGRHGINCDQQRFLACRNNIFTSNGGYGIYTPNLGNSTVDPAVDYNWFGTGSLANTSGARSSLLLAGTHDLSGDPQYVNASAGDFTPQNAAVQAGSP